MDETQQVQRFFARLQEDKALSQEYRAAVSAALEAAVATTVQEVAARHGFRFPVAAARAHLAKRARELDEEQLAAVAGGIVKAPTSTSTSGSLGPSTSGGSSFLTNPLVLAGIVAAAIAVPLAIDDDDAS